MPVTTGATSTEANLNSTNPSAPSESTPANNYVNIQWQASAPSPDPNDPNFEVRDVSAYATFAGRIAAIAAGSSDLTYTLDPASTWTNTLWWIKKTDSAAGKVKVTAFVGGSPIVTNTIEGASEYDLVNQYDFVVLFSDGAHIYIFGSNTA